MRWRKRIKYRPTSGDERTRRRFLILPKRIDRDCRWLEWATWTQRYSTVGYYWNDWRWENK